MKTKSKLISLLLILSVFSPTIIHAQTIQYCNSVIVGLWATSRYNHKTIKDLKVTLVDAEGKPYLVQKSIFTDKGKFVENIEQTATFWQNPLPNKDLKHKNPNIETRHFDFAKDHYLFIAAVNEVIPGKLFIKIEDVDGIAIGGEFETVVISIKSEHIKSLCNKGLKNPYSSDNYQARYIVLPDKKNPTEKHTEDYNFDGKLDYCIANPSDSALMKYYFYNPTTNDYDYSPLLSSLYDLKFDWVKKSIKGYQITTTKTSKTTDTYEWVNNAMTLTERYVVTLIDAEKETYKTQYFKLENGKLSLIKEDIEE